jgi:glyoxylase-like metal-dependent hydrolase (beta-lactamase superfamily II)
MKMLQVQEFFDTATSTLTYVAWDPDTRDAVVVDPVLDYDPAASKVSETSVEKLAGFLASKELRLHLILETHCHADHVSGAQALKRRHSNAKIAIGRKIGEVQKLFKDVFDLGSAFATDGSQFEMLLDDGQVVRAGSLEFRVMFTPGHTPACATYIFGEHAFVGDALFMPDYGSGRCDFPGGDASELYRTIHDKLYSLPSATKIYTGHDYQPGGRPLKFCATIAEESATNIHVKTATSREEFVKFRTERDKTLSAPKLLLPSVQLNLNAGHLPAPRTNGRRYLNIPIE